MAKTRTAAHPTIAIVRYPLQEEARLNRRGLLAVSSVGLAIRLANAFPTQIAALGITFSTTNKHNLVFSDPFIIIVEDCEDANGETSYHAIGRSGSQTLLVVVHVDRSTQEEEVVQIISSRKAEDYEQSTYSDQFA